MKPVTTGYIVLCGYLLYFLKREENLGCVGACFIQCCEVCCCCLRARTLRLSIYRDGFDTSCQVLGTIIMKLIVYLGGRSVEWSVSVNYSSIGENVFVIIFCCSYHSSGFIFYTESIIKNSSKGSKKI